MATKQVNRNSVREVVTDDGEVLLEKVIEKTGEQQRPRGVAIRTMDELARFAKFVHESGLAPKAFNTPQKIAVAVQLGMELGLLPLSAMQNICVINGMPGIYGDAALALVEKSGLMEDFDEHFECGGKPAIGVPANIPEDFTAVCVSKRTGRARPTTTRFSVADAKRAALWGKAGPWQQHPARMLKWRARGFNLRDGFPDVLKGFRTADELADYPSVNRPAETPAAKLEAAIEATPSPVAVADPPTGEQIAKIAFSKGLLGLSDAGFCGLMESVTGVKHSAKLTRDMAAKLLDAMEVEVDASRPETSPFAGAFEGREPGDEG